MNDNQLNSIDIKKRFDFSAPNTLQVIKEMIDQAFSDAEKHTGLSEEGAHEDYSFSRRKAAILQLVKEADERFGEKYPDLNPAIELIRLSAPIHTLTFNKLNRVYDIELSAAIWILDYLKANDLFDQAVEHFPASREEINSVYLPILSDAVHSDDELRSMIYLIRNRNRGGQGFDEKHPLTDPSVFNQTGAEVSELPDRKHFNAVFSLIEKSEVKAAQELYIANIRELFDSILSVISKCKQKTTDNSKESQDKQKDLESLYSHILLLSAYKRGELTDDTGLGELLSGIEMPSVNNPYEMCFAFLSLLEAGSNYVWLYNLSYDILEVSCQLLPWANANVVDPDDDLDELSIDYAYMQSLVEKMPDWSDNRTNDILYQKCIPSPLVGSQRDTVSISQLVFLSSGLIPPRQGRSISYTKLLLNESSFSKEQQNWLYEYVSLAYSVNHKGADFTTPDEDEVVQELSKDKEDIQDKENEIKRLRSEIKHLKNIINRSQHEKKDLSVELREVNRRLEASRNELSELRSLIRESIDKEEETPVLVSFPYTVQKRTVIIGGHQSWTNAIKPLIKNARFIAASEQPNTSLILNAETVWIQTNAISHSSFYKIIDVIRRNNIKVCYFKYSSAEKCAEQIALDDSAEEQETPLAE